jgi:hypothetical protein
MTVLNHCLCSSVLASHYYINSLVITHIYVSSHTHTPQKKRKGFKLTAYMHVRSKSLERKCYCWSSSLQQMDACGWLSKRIKISFKLSKYTFSSCSLVTSNQVSSELLHPKWGQAFLTPSSANQASLRWNKQPYPPTPSHTCHMLFLWCPLQQSI